MQHFQEFRTAIHIKFQIYDRNLKCLDVTDSIYLLGGFGNKKLWCHDHRHIKTCGSIKESNARLPANVCQVAEVPGHEVIDLMIGGNRHMQSVSYIFTV